MKRKLIITLKSDLCVASGYSYAGIIDADICYDKYGLPYIPARRLKGCFRDTAENLLYGIIDADTVRDIFGIGGASNKGNIRISNARLNNYEDIVKELRALRQNKETSDEFTQQRVLEQYSHIVAQTAIGDNDVAEDQSLRYTRVINHYRPGRVEDSFEEIVFEAVIEYDECNNGDNTMTDAISLIAGATKNIGLKRNRGMGVVHCKLSDEIIEDRCIDNKVVIDEIFSPEDEYVITYCLKNDEPLMLSQMSDIHSEKFISGQSMLGHLAGKYLSKPGKRNDSEEFSDLFLNGKTKFTSAYIAEITNDNEAVIYYPAPANINRLKKTKEFVDAFFMPEKIEPGNQPKKLKGNYVHSFLNGDVNCIGIKEVDMKLHYHHRKDKKASDGSVEAGILYPSEAIEPNQVFAGEIYTVGKYAELFFELLNGQDFYFGKSKSAQYGHCVCEVLSVNLLKNSIENSEKEKLLVTLKSDAIFTDGGNYSVDRNVILRQLANCIPGASLIEDSNGEDDNVYEMMDTSLVSGYQTKWNMHKPLFPIVKGGSCFVLDGSQCEYFPSRIWVGTKNQEGYGYAEVSIFKKRELHIAADCAENNDAEIKIDAFKPQYINIIKEKLIKALIVGADKKKRLTGVSKTQINRAMLMLRQCDDFADFQRRIESIKTHSVKSKFIEAYIKPISDDGKVSIAKLVGNDVTAKKYYDLLDRVKCTSIDDIWKDYLLNDLTVCKYEAKED